MSAIPQRLTAMVQIAPDRFLSREGVQELLTRAVHLSTGGGDVVISVDSTWTGNLRWARNEIITSGDTTNHAISITRTVRGASARASTNRIDEAAIRDCVQRAERRLRFNRVDVDALPPRTSEQYDAVNCWSDSTAHLDAAMRADLQHTLVAPAMTAQLLAAGYLEVQVRGIGAINTGGLFAYVPQTRVEYSVTTRNAKGTGSGWAGVDNRDWDKIDTHKLSAISLDKCQRSADPVALEPGRYTVILEPQAVADLLLPLIQSLHRESAERGLGPWADASGAVIPDSPGENIPGNTGLSKLSQMVLDERVTISTDPRDPEMPFVPFRYDGSPIRATTWIERGVLKALAYERQYANMRLSKSDPLIRSDAFRMAGGPASIPEMIASTERGLLVTRLVNIRELDGTSLLQTGTTADGLWLIERGKITAPVKNFRFRESPLYAFNNLEALGEPTRVLMVQPTIVPPAKVRDFSMTSLADAI